MGHVIKYKVDNSLFPTSQHRNWFLMYHLEHCMTVAMYWVSTLYKATFWTPGGNYCPLSAPWKVIAATNMSVWYRDPGSCEDMQWGPCNEPVLIPLEVVSSFLSMSIYCAMFSGKRSSADLLCVISQSYSLHCVFQPLHNTCLESLIRIWFKTVSICVCEAQKYRTPCVKLGNITSWWDSKTPRVVETRSKFHSPKQMYESSPSLSVTMSLGCVGTNCIHFMNLFRFWGT